MPNSTFDAAFDRIFAAPPPDLPLEQDSELLAIHTAREEAQRDYYVLNENNNTYCFLTENLQFSAYEHEFHLIKESFNYE
jgi:hypothetical protein